MSEMIECILNQSKKISLAPRRSPVDANGSILVGSLVTKNEPVRLSLRLGPIIVSLLNLSQRSLVGTSKTSKSTHEGLSYGFANAKSANFLRNV